MMTGRFPMSPLGEVLTKSEEWISIEPHKLYREVTVRLRGKGVIQRREVTGAEIAAARRRVVRSQQFILSRIDARNGALGLVPNSLDGAVVSNDFPVFSPNPLRLLPSFLGWMSKTSGFVDLCMAASEGTTNRVRLKEDRFLATQIPLPPIAEQRRIVARIEGLAAKIGEARRLQKAVEAYTHRMLLGAYMKITQGVRWKSMAEVAPLVRRPVQIDPSEKYYEIGIKSFGKGTFHKPPVDGASLGTKKVFRIETNDLLFNIVFAWEASVAVAKPQDHGRVGSHRFLTCVPKEGLTTSVFLCFHFLTDAGLEQLGKASPGGAGRNRTLGLKALQEIVVPLPAFHEQIWFGSLLAKAESFKHLRGESAVELDAILPSILDKAFKGEL